MGLSGTARFQGMGGVSTALGADLTSLHTNPAGLGFYRKSEWSVTPSLTFTNNTGTMLGNNLNDGNAFFNVPNFGIVFANVRRDTDKSDWRGGSFGVSFNRMQNFNNQVSYLGTVNRRNSIIDYLRSTADDLDIPVGRLAVAPDQIGFNVGYNQMLAQLAYAGYLIESLAQQDANGNPIRDENGNTIPDPRNYYRSNLSDNARVVTENGRDILIEDPSQTLPSGTIRTTGGSNQWNIGYGGNYQDKLYVGATVGIANIRYNSRNDYTETVQQATFRLLDRYTLSDNLTVSGTGVNATLGVIYRLNDVVRLGGSFTTPTIYSMRETSFTQLNTTLLPNNRLDIDDLSISERSVDNEFRYRLTTPLRASLGAAFFIGKYGFVSGDVEYRPYRAARLGGDFGTGAQGINQQVAYNNEIRDLYRNLFNFRVGGEFRYEIFRLRAGAMFQDDPFSRNVDNLNRTMLVYTGGAGLKIKSFFVDLAFAYTTSQQAYTPYPLGPSATFQNRFTTASLTLGSSF